ncbi:MAG: metallophosphoesterase [Clostridia bacterium]|nr:metallophosphoesterase [Clostridia bacterium]
MAIFALSDLHLSEQVDKPMDVFGTNWENYTERIKDMWQKTVNDTDTVLIPGDVSWGTYLEQAEKDFRFIEQLPGIKYISKGNHDYWWETVTKMNQFLDAHAFKTIRFVYNSAFLAENVAVCATKGFEKETEERLKARELMRMENSLIEGKKLNGSKMVAMLHYPPFYKNGEPITEMHALLKKYDVHTCVYGHIHNRGHKIPVDAESDGIRFRLVSCDQVEFCPVALAF